MWYRIMTCRFYRWEQSGERVWISRKRKKKSITGPDRKRIIGKSGGSPTMNSILQQNDKVDWSPGKRTGRRPEPGGRSHIYIHLIISVHALYPSVSNVPTSPVVYMYISTRYIYSWDQHRVHPRPVPSPCPLSMSEST